MTAHGVDREMGLKLKCDESGRRNRLEGIDEIGNVGVDYQIKEVCLALPH